MIRSELEQLMHEVDLEIQEATERALKAPPPPKGSALRYLYSETVDPTSSEFETEAKFAGEPRTMVDEINAHHRTKRCARDLNVVVFGEDVADCSREEHLKEVKGKGGVFKATQGLQIAFGSERVFQYADRRGGHRGPRGRHGDARAEAGGRDSVFRLHLAGDDADSR